ncbi:hypothetical protein CDAR_398231 [Caerostris darwini]|uniref:Uncharacterized protein n=1 Tax=Caerostris darwini TaxID=1538125 RepID=A0AAV4WRV3_9ARAC|nr:hypothetical protein CDAR_398231 [Caerostris darwini]
MQKFCLINSTRKKTSRKKIAYLLLTQSKTKLKVEKKKKTARHQQHLMGFTFSDPLVGKTPIMGKESALPTRMGRRNNRPEGIYPEDAAYFHKNWKKQEENRPKPLSCCWDECG